MNAYVVVYEMMYGNVREVRSMNLVTDTPEEAAMLFFKTREGEGRLIGFSIVEEIIDSKLFTTAVPGMH